MTIQTAPTADGKRISIRFPYDPNLVATVKTIPGAKWDGASWTVAKRYAKQVEAFAGVAADADAAYDAMIGTKNPEIREAAARIVTVRIDVRKRVAEVSPAGKAYLGPIGDLPGAKSQKGWDGKFCGYLVPIATEDRVDALIVALAAVVSGERSKAAAIEAEKAARAAERVEKYKTDVAAGRSRTMVLSASAPSVGAVIRLGSSVVRITRHGKTWILGDDSSAYGAHPSWEGERVCYAYYERATDAETASLVERETAAEEAKKVAAARSSAIGRIESSKDRTHLGCEPAGETIWRDDTLAAGGYRRWVVLTSDGWVWHCVYVGGDGDTWGDFNLGYNTRGSRVRATDELVAAIRGNATTSPAGFGTADIPDMEALCAALRTALPKAKFDPAGPASIFLGSMVGNIGVEWGSRRRMDPVEMRHRIDGITADDIAKIFDALPSIRAGHDANEKDRIAGVGRSWNDSWYGPNVGDFVEVRGSLRIVTSSTRSTVTEAENDCAEGQARTYFGYRYPTAAERERFQASGQKPFID